MQRASKSPDLQVPFTSIQKALCIVRSDNASKWASGAPLFPHCFVMPAFSAMQRGPFLYTQGDLRLALLPVDFGVGGIASADTPEGVAYYGSVAESVGRRTFSGRGRTCT